MILAVPAPAGKRADARFALVVLDIVGVVGVFLWGDPIYVPRDADAETMEAKRLEVEEAMNALADRADGMMGQPRIEPADPQAAGAARA